MKMTRVGCSERIALKQVYYQGWNTSPAQVGCMRQVLRAGALGRPRGMGWRGRWEGGLGWGAHVNPWLIHVNVWQKPLQYCKVISLQLIKINGKKKVEEYACNAGDLGSIPGLGRSPGEGNGYPLQYCGLENSTDCVVHGVEKSWIRLSDFHFTSLQYSCLKNPMDRGAWWATVHRDLKESDMPEWLSTWPQIFISLILFCYSELVLHIFLNAWYCLTALK